MIVFVPGRNLWKYDSLQVTKKYQMRHCVHRPAALIQEEDINGNINLERNVINRKVATKRTTVLFFDSISKKLILIYSPESSR